MTIDEAKKLLTIERECVNRNNQPFGFNCDRECGKCDLRQNTDTLIEMYDNVAEWLEELKDYRDKNKIVVSVKCEDVEEVKELFEKHYRKTYNKAIDDMIAIIKEMRETATAVMWTESEYACDRFIEQAEKLKGEKNEI